MIAVDTNVLVYAHRAETEFHTAAARELIALAEGAAHWGLPIFCAVEFLRVVTHRRVFSPPSTLEQAVDFLDGVVASPSCRVVLPGAGFLDLLTATSRGADARGNLVIDAQTAALCREHGISAILTNDRDFERFDGLQVRYLERAAS
ncbi:MAG: PIN domain-containing protein [Gemmatimonadetes bacterium]|nr:PIN domain-containing protein [Gemmatimonadota bacterium]